MVVQIFSLSHKLGLPCLNLDWENFKKELKFVSTFNKSSKQCFLLIQILNNMLYIEFLGTHFQSNNFDQSIFQKFVL